MRKGPGGRLQKNLKHRQEGRSHLPASLLVSPPWAGGSTLLGFITMRPLVPAKRRRGKVASGRGSSRRTVRTSTRSRWTWSTWRGLWADGMNRKLCPQRFYHAQGEPWHQQAEVSGRQPTGRSMIHAWQVEAWASWTWGWKAACCWTGAGWQSPEHGLSCQEQTSWATFPWSINRGRWQGDSWWGWEPWWQPPVS